MNKEEQEAIENLKKDFILMNNGEYAKTDDYILYNYISKLQEENKLMEKELYKCSEHIVPCMFETSKDYISKDKIREYIKENKRIYEMKTPNRNRVVYKPCVLLTKEAEELL